MDVDPLIIAVLNMKGGVGKTSICHHLTAPLLEMGNRVLLVDLDPQANLTAGLFGAETVERFPIQRTVAALFDDRLDPLPEEVITETKIEGVSIVPGAWSLSDYDYPKPAEHGDRQYAVQSFLDEVRGEFDVVLLDCRPSLQLLSWNALLAAEFVLVPFQPEDYGAQGIVHIQRIIDQALAGYNQRLRLLGYLLNKVARRSVHKTFETILRTYYGEDVFQVTVPDSTHFPEAVSHHQPVGHYKKRSKASQSVRDLAAEVFERVGRIRQAPPRYLYPGNRMGTDANVGVSQQELIRKVG